MEIIKKLLIVDNTRAVVNRECPVSNKALFTTPSLFRVLISKYAENILGHKLVPFTFFL